MRLIDADELRCKAQHAKDIAKYDGGLLVVGLGYILDAPTAEPSNPPLTLEQLKQMQGEPVWVVSLKGDFKSQWVIVQGTQDYMRGDTLTLVDFEYRNGKSWLAYAHEPVKENDYDNQK